MGVFGVCRKRRVQNTVDPYGFPIRSARVLARPVFVTPICNAVYEVLGSSRASLPVL